MKLPPLLNFSRRCSVLAALLALALGGSNSHLVALTTPATGAIAAGNTHTAVFKSDGTVWAWGNNDGGQLGDGTTTNRLALPAPVAGLSGVAAVSASSHTLALKTDGTVWAWGANWAGQLGDGTTTNQVSPVQVGGLSGIVAVCAGADFSIALKGDGTVWTWGGNGTGQLGDGSTSNQASPVQAAGLSGIVGITAGGWGTRNLALTSDGTVWEWGPGTWDNPIVAPAQIGGLTGIAAIATGSQHQMALKNDGTVWTWGANSRGQLGDGSGQDQSSPVAVAGLGNVVAIAAGDLHSLAVRGDHTFWSWGYNGQGQLGDGTTNSRATPAQVTGLSGALAPAATGASTVVLKTDGTVWLSGVSATGSRGSDRGSIYRVPFPVAGLTGVTTIAAGDYSSAILKTDGTLLAWGWGVWAQNFGTPTPTPVSGLTGVVAISGGGSGDGVGAAIKSDGTVWTLQQNEDGTNAFAPVDGFSDAVAAVLLQGWPVVLKSDGTVSTQQWDDDGNLVIASIDGLSGITALAAGREHGVALKNDGTVWSWGRDSEGEFGDGTATYDPTTGVAQAIGLTGVTRIAAGSFHTLALKNDGTVWAWGGNFAGQLGDGTSGDQSTPTQVPGLSGVVAIAATDMGSVAVKADGSVWCWGAIDEGWRDQTSIPVQVPGLTGIINVSARHGYHVLALKQDGTVWTWGDNDFGQLAILSSRFNGPDLAAIRLIPWAGDTSQNGVSDAWELQYFGTLTHDVTADTDGDGLMDIQEYTLGTDPTKADTDGDGLSDFVQPYAYYNGVRPTLTKLGGDNQTAAPGLFNAQPFDVAVWNAAGTAPLVNAPVTFTVTQGGGLLATAAANAPAFPLLTLQTDALGTAQLFYQQPATAGTVSHILVTAATAQVTFTSTSTAGGGSGGSGGGGGNQPPTVTLTAPAAGAVFNAPATITLAATASDSDGSVAKVEFFQGTTKLGESTTALFTYTWSGVVPGSYILSAKATDNQGATAQSATVSITVQSAIGDTDGNGLPDDWEIANFGHIGVDPNADPDGDGLTNLQEYQQGTDPNDFFNGVVPQVEAANGGAPDSSDALVMTVRKPDGTPWPNAPGTFQITAGDRRISATPGGPNFTSTVQVRTDANGVAKVYLESL
jgi:alpha-tubulin suppressor-like RCC1 family protein